MAPQRYTGRIHHQPVIVLKLQGKIYLIGMPGSGKSFFARLLSEHFSYETVDLDTEIEKKEGRTIPEIFAEKGEAYFRKVENEVLHEVTENATNRIISTGGGTPCFYGAMDYMNKHGVTIFLKTSRETLIDRLLRKSDRPLMQGDVAGKVDELLKKRLPYYEKARISIEHRDPDLLANQLEAFRN